MSKGATVAVEGFLLNVGRLRWVWGTYETGCSITLTLKGSNSPLRGADASTSFTFVTLYLEKRV